MYLQPNYHLLWVKQTIYLSGRIFWIDLGQERVRDYPDYAKPRIKLVITESPKFRKQRRLIETGLGSEDKQIPRGNGGNYTAVEQDISLF